MVHWRRRGRGKRRRKRKRRSRRRRMVLQPVIKVDMMTMMMREPHRAALGWSARGPGG